MLFETFRTGRAWLEPTSRGRRQLKSSFRGPFGALSRPFLVRSRSLRRSICLVDSAMGLRREDERLWEQVMDSGQQMMVVLTKADRCHPLDLHKHVAEVLAALQHFDQELIWP